MSLAKHAIPKPLLLRLDPGAPKRIKFEFVPTDFSQSISSTWSEASSLGRRQPISQFTRGDADSISFSARFFARDLTENIQPVIDALKAAVRPDPSLGRPPLFDFTWGRAVHDVVVVQSVGGLQIASMRPDGTVRDATLQLTLRHYERFDLQQTDPDARQHDTFFRVTKEGDSWESLAATFYNDPLLGELLRRQNPDKPYLSPGLTVKVLDFERFRDGVVTPASIPLLRTANGIALRITTFAGRSRPKVSTVVKR